MPTDATAQVIIVKERINGENHTSLEMFNPKNGRVLVLRAREAAGKEYFEIMLLPNKEDEKTKVVAPNSTMSVGAGLVLELFGKEE